MIKSRRLRKILDNNLSGARGLLHRSDRDRDYYRSGSYFGRFIRRMVKQGKRIENTRYCRDLEPDGSYFSNERHISKILYRTDPACRHYYGKNRKPIRPSNIEAFYDDEGSNLAEHSSYMEYIADHSN